MHTPSAVTLRLAEAADIEEVRALFREYVAWLGVDLCFQDFDAELATLPGRYAPPSGRLCVAEVDGRIAGAVGLREIAPLVCEMKRLFVRDWARGRGAGRLLVGRIVADARAIGYNAMRLDTLQERMASANALYDEFGFREIPAYYANPVANVRYMELDLRAQG